MLAPSPGVSRGGSWSAMPAVKSRRGRGGGRPLRPSRPSPIMSGMKKVLEPAVRLMNRLRYPQKFALISLLFAIPIAFMMSLWLVELHSRMAFTARERGGLEFLVALRHVLEPLETSRGLRSL